MIDLSLLQDFLIEAGEHLAELESDLLQLETEPDRRDIISKDTSDQVVGLWALNGQRRDIWLEFPLRRVRQ